MIGFLYALLILLIVGTFIWLSSTNSSKPTNINPQVHKQALLVIYTQASVNPSPFEKFLFDEAIRKLNSDVPPHIVETWVINVEKAWRK